MKKIFTLVLLSVMAISLAGCSKYETLDTTISGEIDIMLWSGDGSYQEDIGHQNLAPEDITGQNNAAAYAVAKAFNEIYPNVQINIYAKAGDPDANEVSWQQELENFKADHGKYPDVWASTDLVGDIARGLVADLSQFEDDPLYQSFNPAVMEMMNYYGFQAGLPQYMVPWGVFVNKSLAEDNNIDMPDPMWSIDEYTDFISEADMETFYGAVDVPVKFMESGTNVVVKQMVEYDGTGDFVNLNSDEMKDMLDYAHEWADYSVFPQFWAGNVDSSYIDANWWWGYKFFTDNSVLTLDGDPWMLGTAANANSWLPANFDFDYYPRPSTEYVENHVGVVLDPMAVHNYAMDDGNPEMTDAEFEKTKLAYTFAAFWVGDTASWQARADQMYVPGEVAESSLNDSFPLVTGEEFDAQMDIWYSVTNHSALASEAQFPGFHTVVDLWNEGKMWDVSDKAYPYWHEFEGAKRQNLYEWLQMGNDNVTGVQFTSDQFVDTIKGLLPTWNEDMNQRFEESIQALKDGLIEFYQFEDKDFS